jgi:hypothetical protein
VSGLAPEDEVRHRWRLAGGCASGRSYWGSGRWGRRSRACGSKGQKESLSKNWLASAGRVLDGCASGGSAGSWIGDALSPDRGLLSGLLSAVPDGLQHLVSKEDPGSLSDGHLLSELFVRQRSLQSL